MTVESKRWQITRDDLSKFTGKAPAFVTFGETMMRDMPTDLQRPDRILKERS